MILKLIEKRDRVDRVKDIRNKVQNIVAQERLKAKLVKFDEFGVAVPGKSPSP